MSDGGVDLSIICRNCGEQVSPYSTECPYCGGRLRKRAPKIGSRQDPARRAERRIKRSRLKRRDPSIAPDRRLVIVPALLVTAVLLSAFVRAGVVHAADVEVAGPLFGDWWKLLSSPFVHRDIGYAAVVLCVFALFGSQIERRLGRSFALVVWLFAGALGCWLASLVTIQPCGGALAAAAAVASAWTLAELLARRRGATDGDLVGGLVAIAVLIPLPLLVSQATWIALGSGLVVGAITGLVLAKQGR